MNDSKARQALTTVLEEVGAGFLVVTGAGVSAASGIPTFRGAYPGAVWKRDVTELGTNRYSEEDPAGSWSWYTSRFDIVLDKRPNPAHYALAAIKRWQVSRGMRTLCHNVSKAHLGLGRPQCGESGSRAACQGLHMSELPLFSTGCGHRLGPASIRLPDYA